MKYAPGEMRRREWQEAATICLADRTLRGERYRPNVVEMAVSAAVETWTVDEAVDAMERAFSACRISINPNWDGSIA